MFGSSGLSIWALASEVVWFRVWCSRVRVLRLGFACLLVEVGSCPNAGSIAGPRK